MRALAAAEDAETDPDRLTRAFSALTDAGIVARENFTCCRTCGQAEIGAEASPGCRGFVSFHGGGTAGAVLGNGLALYYGGFDGSERTTASVGRQVVAALEQVGLPVRWNGDPGRAIDVSRWTGAGGWSAEPTGAARSRASYRLAVRT